MTDLRSILQQALEHLVSPASCLQAGEGGQQLSLIRAAAEAWLVHPEPWQDWGDDAHMQWGLPICAHGSVRVAGPTSPPLNPHPSTVMKRLVRLQLLAYCC